MGKHGLHLLRSVVDPLVAVIVGISVEGRRHDAGRLDPPEEVRVHQRTMLDAMPGIGAGMAGQHPLVGVQHHVDGHVAVGVNADAKAMGRRVFDRLVDFLLGHGQDAVVIRAFVGRAHVHRALGCRTVGGEFDRAHANDVIAEAGSNTGHLESFIDLGVAAGHVGHPEIKLVGVAGVLVGDEIVVVAEGIGRRRQARRRHVSR